MYEVTDIYVRYIASVTTGEMKEDWHGEVYLLTCEVLKTVNHFTIAMLFDDARGHMV